MMNISGFPSETLKFLLKESEMNSVNLIKKTAG